MSQLIEEISRRRTFAIISHPDAGKTTLTEKFLLYGGAIAQAGVVKGKKNSRAATSDWMEIEKQRGISVTSSVMQFQYNGFCINILDTPGHQDFSEDTYRTLMAADSAVMVIDGAKGVEPQTRKLFKVCAMRHIPIFTFINKMDREAKDPFDLLRRGGAGAGHRDLRHELAHRLRQGVSGRLRPGEGRAAVLLRRSPGKAGRHSWKSTCTTRRWPSCWTARKSTGSSSTTWSFWPPDGNWTCRPSGTGSCPLCSSAPH